MKMIDNDIRHYVIYVRPDADYRLGINDRMEVGCWTESRAFAEFVAAKHIVVERATGKRIFPKLPSHGFPVFLHGLKEARIA